MTVGKGGKYDDECEAVFMKTKADAVLLCVCGGEKGDGFSMTIASNVVHVLPKVLREVADQIEEDLKRIRQATQN